MAKPVDDERVLREAARLFRRQGYASTTVRQIAKAARMLPGSLHYRYPSKDDVLTAILERGADTLLAEFHKETGKTADPVERIRLAMGRYLELLLESEDALFIMLFEGRGLPPAAKAKVDAARRRVEDFWDFLILGVGSTGKMRENVDVELIRQMGVGASNWVATWYRKSDGRSPRDIADLFWLYLSYGLMDEKARAKDFQKLFERK